MQGWNMQQLKLENSNYFEYLSHSELIEQLDIHTYIKPELYRKFSAKTFRHIFSLVYFAYI